jgi:hypothetical protein
VRRGFSVGVAGQGGRARREASCPQGRGGLRCLMVRGGAEGGGP